MSPTSSSLAAVPLAPTRALSAPGLPIGLVGTDTDAPRRTFYVDASGGVDTASGRSPASAWKTIAKVNAMQSSLRPGDAVLFKRGETWTGTTLAITTSGTARRPIAYADYGAGAKPKLDGGTTWTGNAVNVAGVDCIAFTGAVSWVSVANLELSNGLDFGLSMQAASHVVVADCDMHDVGNDCLLIMTGSDSITVLRGTYYNAKNRTGTYVATGIEAADGSTNILIDGAECYGNATTGFGFHNHNTADQQGRTNVPRWVTLRNAYSHDNTGSGIQIQMGDTSDWPFDMVVEDSRFESNGTYGINLTKTSASTVYPQNVTIRRNVVKNNTGAGIIDWNIQGTGHQITNNLVLLSADHCVSFANITNVTFYNNTLYQAANTSFNGMVIVSTPMSGLVLQNNLWITQTANSLLISTGSGANAGLSSDYNFFDTPATSGQTRWKLNGTNVTFANWKASGGQDAHSQALIRASVVAVGTDFHLQAGSPCIDAGIDVGLPFLGAAPDCGYAEAA